MRDDSWGLWWAFWYDEDVPWVPPLAPGWVFSCRENEGLVLPLALPLAFSYRGDVPLVPPLAPQSVLWYVS